MMKKILLLAFSLFMISNLCVFAQSSFEEHRRQMIERYENYRNKVNDDYAKYMEAAWKRFEAREPIRIPKEEPDPVAPIRIPYMRVPDIPESTPVIPDEIIDLSFDLPAPKPIEPIEKPIAVPFHGTEFDFYGAGIKVHFTGDKLPKLDNSSERQITKFWRAMGKLNFDTALYELQAVREELDLCDWAYFLLCKEMSDRLCPDNENAATLLSAYTLCQSGFMIRIGRNPADDKLHILAATDYTMLNRPYWEMDGAQFFLMDDSGVSSLNIYDKAFEGEQKLRLKISGRNLFPESPTESRQIASSEFPATKTSVSTNSRLIEFYEGYPMIMVGSDSRTRWSFYLTELSEVAKQELYPTLSKAIEGKSELEAVEILLNFIQTGFEYGYDTQVWGEDRAFFPEETLYYPFDDCEDRAVLFSRLVKDLVGLKIALVYYPGHLATAVRFNSEVKGDYISIGEDKYIVCDPTYINANVGKTMPDMDNSGAFAILL